MATWNNKSKSSDPTYTNDSKASTSYTNDSKASASYTNDSKSSTSYTNQDKSGGGGIVIGNPIGLLLSLTYAENLGGISWTNQSKS